MINALKRNGWWKTITVSAGLALFAVVVGAAVLATLGGAR